ncbi:hypothetical protein [Streptomyces sp. NBC_01768]|uniref:hypothetical protein n=1 Tax=Streptomyces sp. NBC_01768 TaxID=2975938 RepID=UPI002DD90836|nr:hypothetical protein [Streptomyces sp. NBC_01768]WSC34043.1 hypothetical protein OG902_46765 [Streptomyces sp. NBC_01768]
MPKPASAQLTIIRDGLFIPRSLTADITDTAPNARRLVKEHYGRRPLAAVELVVTSPKRIPRLAVMSQGAAAGVPENVYEEKLLSCTAKPNDLYSVTVIAPKNTVQILINAKRLRRRPREIGATLVWAFVEVDQLSRKGAVERRIALTRHEMGTHALSKGKARSLYRIEAEMEDEAAKVTGRIVGEVIRQNRQAEAAAREEAATAQNAAA